MTPDQKALVEAVAQALRETSAFVLPYQDAEDMACAAIVVVLEAAAKVAKDHVGSAREDREKRRELKTTMRFASDEEKMEIWAEERGENIASEMIERAIRALVPKETNDA